jgi:outer membrane protein assembly factor BamB
MPIRVSRDFERANVIPITRAPDDDWPMFRKTPAGSSFTATPVEPPLELAWVTPLPGLVALSSPVVAGGRVYLGCRTKSAELGDSGVLCCDAVSGAARWFAPVPGGVALAPAVAANIVLVSSMGESVFGLDAATGQALWGRRTPGNRYKMTAPTVEGASAWVGAEAALVQLDPRTGVVRWETDRLGSSWCPAIYSAPAVSPNHVYCGFYGTPGIVPDGFSIIERANGTVVRHENGAFRSPIWADGVLLLAGALDFNDQVLTARDPMGSVLWTATTRLRRSTGSPALGHGVVVVAGINGRVEGFRASDGEHLWTHATGVSLLDMSAEPA